MSSKTNTTWLKATAAALCTIVFSAYVQGATGPTSTGKVTTSVPAETAKSSLPALVSPTLGEIAEQQRLKQLAEIEKTRADAKIAEAAKKLALQSEAKAAAPKAEAAGVTSKQGKLAKKPVVTTPVYIPAYKMVATYRVKNIWFAELTDGKNLAVVKEGDQYNQFSVNQIGNSGMQVTGSKGLQSIMLGGAF